MNDIVVNKVQSRAGLAGNDFRTDYMRQDAAVLNVTRACEQAIDLANHLIRTHKIGIPVSSADSFALLAMKRVIPTSLEDKMRRMVGFRNIAVHEYRKLNVDIVEAVIRTGLDDLWAFTDYVVKYLKSTPAS
jgi:uncharacterized protein YutE (UPF0331/DUF86 family)